QVADGLGQRELELLQAARHPDRPALVPEVPLDLAHDGGRGVGGELHAALQVEPVDRLDQPDRGDLGEVVQPLAAVPEPARKVLHQRQMQFDQVAADTRPFRILGRQLGQSFEQLAGARPVGRGVLDPHGLRRSLGDLVVLGHLDLELAAHPDLEPLNPAAPGVPELTFSRRLRSTIDTWSSGPRLESTVPARAESTVQAKVSRAGIRGSAAVTDTVIVISSAPRSKAHSRFVPGIAWESSIAQASSTAMRRSSISSRVKSSRAARPAVAVRSTDRY